MGKLFVFYKRQHSDQAYKTWFEPIKSVELNDNALYIQVPVNSSTNGWKNTMLNYLK